MNSQIRVPFFIVSSGRAGSTLLSTILNKSEDLFVPPESDFIARGYPFFHGHQEFGEEDRAILIDLFRTTSQDDGWGLMPDQLSTRLRDGKPSSFAEVNKLIYGTFCQQRGLSDVWCGIKRPMLIASVDRILRTFPDAKIIHILRDGRDVCLSFQGVHQVGVGFGPNNILTAALYWVDGLRRMDPVSESSVYEIRYEDLVTHPERELRQLCAFLDIPYRDSFVNSDQEASDAKQIIMDQHKNTVHKKIFGAIDGRNIHKYQKSMTRSSIFWFECLAAPYLVKYEYPVSLPNLVQHMLRPIQWALYRFARVYNNWRYRRREHAMFQTSCRRAGSRVSHEPT